jgi:hypothetical protein
LATPAANFSAGVLHWLVGIPIPIMILLMLFLLSCEVQLFGVLGDIEEPRPHRPGFLVLSNNSAAAALTARELEALAPARAR